MEHEQSGTHVPRKTRRGTPCARSWDEDWIAQVEAQEAKLDRRVCGARTIGGIPCTLLSAHPSGRCRHHGGFDLTGAPEGNRNAQIHGLYSRRLMVCGSHCPVWQSCPCGGGAPDQGRAVLKLTGAERPQCPYELAEYNAVVTDTVHRVQALATANAFGMHVAHTVALLTVMTSRAAKSLAFGRLTDKTEASAEDKYYMATTKPSAALVAYEKLSRELRRWVTLVEREYTTLTAHRPAARERAARSGHDTGVDPDSVYAGIATAPYVEEPTVGEEITTMLNSFWAAMAQRQGKTETNSTTEDTESTEGPAKTSTFSLEKEKVEPKETDAAGRDGEEQKPNLTTEDTKGTENPAEGNANENIQPDENSPTIEKDSYNSSGAGVSPAEVHADKPRGRDARATSAGQGDLSQGESSDKTRPNEEDPTPKPSLGVPQDEEDHDIQSRDGP